MNAVAKFFQDHHAVPADARGLPDWQHGPTPAVEAHLLGMLKGATGNPRQLARDKAGILAAVDVLLARSDRTIDRNDLEGIRLICQSE